MKYNYIILGSEKDYYKVSFSNLFGIENVRYIAGMYPPKNSLRGVIYRAHFMPAVNNIVDLPFKSLWNGTYFKDDFPVKRPLCFIVLPRWFITNPSLPDYIRRKYPDSKIVLTLFDLLKRQSCDLKKTLDPNWVKEKCDLVTSYDLGDCQRYGFVYHPSVYSKYRDINIDGIPESDVYFIGAPKNRLDEIYRAYEKLKENGLKVDMILSGVDEKDRIYPDEITYIGKNGLSYIENLGHVKQTKCILEILQKDAKGYTLRTNEAIVYGKKLLTNNSMLKKTPFYNPQYISYFSDAKEIDKDFLRRINENRPVNYNYKENISPEELLHFIEDKI